MTRTADANVADSGIAQGIDDLIHLMEGNLGFRRNDGGVGFHVDEFPAKFPIWDESVAHARTFRHDKDRDFSGTGTGTMPFARVFLFAAALPGTISFAASFPGTISFAAALPRTISFSFATTGKVAFTLSFSRTLPLAGRFYFVGRRGAEGDGHDPGDAGDEQGVQPCIFSDGVCDHLNALLQGGMVADTRRHPCDGGRRKKFTLHPEQGATVVETLRWTEPGKGAGVTEEFAIRLKAGDGDPDDGIEPMDRVHQCGDPVLQDVMTADVLELVHQDEAQRGGINTLFPVAGQDEPRMADAAHGGSSAGRTQDGAKILTNAQFTGRFPHLREETRIPARLETRLLFEAMLAPEDPQKEENRPDSPDRDEQRRPKSAGLHRASG
jgi:hypothetical protein